jgi:hypothetical protein
VHVTKVASIQTDLIINELLHGTDVSEEMPANTVIVANSEMEIVEGVVNDPHTGLWVDIQRDPDCLVCGEKMRLTDEVEHESISLDSLGGDIGIVFEEEDDT